MGVFLVTFASSVAYLCYDRNRHHYVAVEYMIQRSTQQRDDGDDSDEEPPIVDPQFGLSMQSEGVIIDSTSIEPGCFNLRQRLARRASSA
eukprot:CAMPEP_0183301864 /NCGR_PEP_ID=MMETSP0160_2-20130417/7848_1 /TAXON_ID=2839 ORGANISM="Odontella Sinensis, Strain Grunow 1884" /NCGR_SAMPLE_ID=MMETSP0160_2 /ASSEMBLY_ACC=CAM_ASM_000250 /LENGTH=89 /DNA_ID=CAMNT_0025464557 /DNA_START=301 /DNA_END=570 /DNA_ORIENTATION=-